MTVPSSLRRAASFGAFAPAKSWRRGTACLLLAVFVLNGCYSTTLLTGAPVPETQVVLNLTDAGRVAYGEQIGRGVGEVEGIVESASDSALVVRITAVRNASGRLETWNGERFVFARSNITNVRERTLSRTRTALLGAAIAAGVTALFLTAKLLGGGSDTPREEPRPPGGEQ